MGSIFCCNGEWLRAGPLVSEEADDPDMAELLRDFLTVLDERRQALGLAFVGRDGDGVKRIAHQLKGAAGCYGFPAITAAARALEEALAKSEDASAARDEVMALCALCVRANGK